MIDEDGAQLKLVLSVPGSFQSLKGMSLDSQGNAWIASGGEGVYLVSPDGTVVKGSPFTGGGVNGPWSVTVDGDDNVWVANFGPMEQGNFYGNDDIGGIKAAISKLAGVNTPGLDPGCPISPVTGYTLPSAGSQVLLHNSDPTKSDPLYGPAGPACYSPLMRQTNCLIDQAGNVWALNNWKPSFDIDMPVPPTVGNPGGDGVVIFVGLAKPPIKKH